MREFMPPCKVDLLDLHNIVKLSDSSM